MAFAESPPLLRPSPPEDGDEGGSGRSWEFEGCDPSQSGLSRAHGQAEYVAMHRAVPMTTRGDLSLSSSHKERAGVRSNDEVVPFTVPAGIRT